MIDAYHFGHMVIDKIPYDQDVIILPDHVRPNWWRQEGHRLQLVDIQKELEMIHPKSLVVGTGKFGMMKVDQELKDYLEKHDIQLFTEPTGKAVKMYNRILLSESNLIGAFHLTC
ncbi:hypothetical protein JW824_02330 [bacterium]|nr:hypothetical protein [bacterium]